MADWFGDFSLNTSSGLDNFDTSSWGGSYDTNYGDFSVPDYGNIDYSSIFSNSDWMNDNLGSTSFDWSQDINWADVLSNPDYFGPAYDPLSDPNASTNSITDYLSQYLSNPDLYSLGSNGGTGDITSLLGEGSNLLGLSGNNSLGSILSENPVDSVSGTGSSSNSLAALIKALLGSGNKALGTANSAMSSPLGQLAKALLATMAKRDSNKNQAQNIQTAQQLARSGSQQGLTSNRTGLPNLNTDSRDPMSYVQQAPTIQR